jgi:cobalamin biosynthesis Mg chelatase CobN
MPAALAVEKQLRRISAPSLELTARELRQCKANKRQKQPGGTVAKEHMSQDPASTVLPTSEEVRSAPAPTRNQGGRNGTTSRSAGAQAAETASQADESSSSDTSNIVWPIVGGVLGGLALLVLALLLWICRRRIEGCCAGSSKESRAKADSSPRSAGSGKAHVATGTNSDKVC